MSTFYGEFEYTIDEKGRLNVPTELRRGLEPEAGESLVITRGYDGHLIAYGIDDWSHKQEAIRKLPMGDPRARNIKRLFGSRAVVQRLDGQGRIRISQQLLESVGIQDRVKIVGTVDCFELWNPQHYDDQMSKVDFGGQDLSDFIL
jgi:MraZ protein